MSEEGISFAVKTILRSERSTIKPLISNPIPPHPLSGTSIGSKFPTSSKF